MTVADDSDFSLHIEPAFVELLRAAGFGTVQAFFDHPDVKVWRSLPDRENAVVELPSLRLHVKRYREFSPVEAEIHGYRLTVAAGLPTAELVAHGRLAEGRSVIVFADLAGYAPADKIITTPADFDRVLEPTAVLAARLHGVKLHHRDLYLCHFLVRAKPFDVRLIDTARVAEMNNPLTRRRWIVKDLAQFWFSTTRLAIEDSQRERWLQIYTKQTRASVTSLRRSIDAKVGRIARHDRNLNASQPTRNISIPK